jgi:putative acetyltransferase
MGDPVIEAERPGDAQAIDRVVRAAFAHHQEVGDMVAEIRASPRCSPGLALVARCEDVVSGFVMLSGTDLVAVDGTRREVLTLTPLAVHPDHQRRGIGAALVAAALNEADRRGEPLVVLEGCPGTTRRSADGSTIPRRSRLSPADPLSGLSAETGVCPAVDG